MERAAPVPEVDSLAELNARVAAVHAADDHRRVINRIHTMGEDFALEAPMLRPLQVEVFQTGLSLEPLVDRYPRETMA